MNDQLNSIEGTIPPVKFSTTGRAVYQGSMLAGDSLGNLHVLTQLLARGDAYILFIGEPGTGKELIADYYVEKSAQDKEKFHKINCASFNDTTLLSELFGHKKGSFTGADSDKAGLFSEINGGGILLDELGAASERFQPSLLRVLETQDFRPVGDSGKPIKLKNARIIAATWQPEKLRRDLFDRFIPVYLPPLAKRKGDIPRILPQLWSQMTLATDGKKQPPQYISRNALDGLKLHNWPGNVRELRKVLSIALLLHPFLDPKVLRTNSFPTIPGLSKFTQKDTSQMLKIQDLPDLPEHFVPTFPLEFFLTPPAVEESEKTKDNPQTDLSISIENHFESISPQQYSYKFWEHYDINKTSISYLAQRLKGEHSDQVIRRHMKEAKERNKVR